ncbi:MAG TPA: PQQ-binding-like beta-propeller repeat protein [Gemmataceae bacterium]|nr:PQQ-binding-like beta-propeller repeat protein [Gemmataceae bacterium]
MCLRTELILGMAILAFVGPRPAQAQEALAWPQWRGPKGDGVSREKGWRANFDDVGPKKLWEAKVGRGFSSPVIHQGRLYLFATDPGSMQRETISCLDAESGKELWSYSYEIQSVKRATNPAGSTTALAGDLVFSYGAGMTLVALDARRGKLAWSRDLMKELPGQPSPYGIQLSPTPFENLIIVPALVHQKAKTWTRPVLEPRGGPYPQVGGVLVAFDQKTGKEVWRNTEGASAWSSPVLAQLDGKTSLVHLTGRYLLGVDPKTGATQWKADLRTIGIKAEDMAASPVILGDIVVTPIHQAFGSPLNGSAGAAAFQIKNGQPKLLWKNTQWCHWFQSAAIWDGHVYAFDERSTFWCLDLQTGKEKWRSKELGKSGSNGGAFMIVDGKLLTIDARQTLRIAELSPQGHRLLTKVVVFNAQPGFECETAPLLLNGLLYCRNHTQLICFDLRSKRP